MELIQRGFNAVLQLPLLRLTPDPSPPETCLSSKGSPLKRFGSSLLQVGTEDPTPGADLSLPDLHHLPRVLRGLGHVLMHQDSVDRLEEAREAELVEVKA